MGIPFVPMSGFQGDNLIEESTNMDWYKGFKVKPKKKEVEGKTLLDALNNVVFAPTGVSGKCFSIEMHHKTVDKAGPGDNVGVNVKGLPKENMPKVGDVMSVEGADGDDDPPKAAETFAFAFFMDKSKDERARGVTIACTTKEFFTDKYHYTIIDAPGHRDFIKNMISGASQADVALLMVPANKGGFETSIQKGNHKKGEVQGQTRQHARLLHLLGVEQVIVGVNKMDSTQPKPYSEARFKEIQKEVKKMLTKIGFKTKKIPFVPMSGFKGDNLIEESTNMV